MGHAADAPRWMPQRDRYARAQKGADAVLCTSHEVLSRLKEYLDLLLHRLFLAVHRWRQQPQSLRDAVQSLGVADIKLSTRLERRQDASDDLSFGVCVEVDQQIAQKDCVEGAELRQRRREVDLHELDSPAQALLDEQRALLSAHTFQAETPQIRLWDVLCTFERIVSGTCLPQHAEADV